MSISEGPSEQLSLEARLERELEHGRRLDERADRLELRQGASVLFSFLAVAIVMVMALLVVFISSGDESTGRAATDSGAATPAPTTAHDHAAAGAAVAAAPKADDSAAANVKFEPFKAVDPTLPAVPAGAVKKFKVDVFEHVTKVSDDLAPTRVWSYGVNGTLHRGTGASAPMVVEQGDKVEITLVNGGSKAMNVTFPHSLDFHSSEVAPNKAYTDIDPGETKVIAFTAKHPGVFMYHCATQPVLMHTGAGMVGAMIVKPKNLPAADKELWLTQQEFYLGAPGKDADMAKMQAKQPDVIAFNGYANQYKKAPITVKRGEKVRMYVLNAGPSIWSAFHIIGTVFDRTVVEGMVGKSAQTINLAPSQGGWVEFTLDAEGNFPFVTHAFGDMTKGALGVLHTSGAPAVAGHGH
jgi:nitrite reductase (NO-forming)